MALYKKIIAALAKGAEVICMLMIAGLVAVIVAELVNRNILGKSFRATIEICGILFLWMAFIGLIPLYHRDGLMRLDFLISRIKGPAYEGLYCVNKLFSLMLGVVMIIAFGAQYPFVSTRYYATITWLPYTVQYLPMMLAGCFFVLKTLGQLLEWAMAGFRQPTLDMNDERGAGT